MQQKGSESEAKNLAPEHPDTAEKGEIRLPQIALVRKAKGEVSWQDDALAVLKFHRHHQSINGLALVGRPKKYTERKGWSVRDTAEALGKSFGSIAEDLKLARAIELDDPIKDFKDRTNALRALKRRSSNGKN